MLNYYWIKCELKAKAILTDKEFEVFICKNDKYYDVYIEYTNYTISFIGQIANKWIRRRAKSFIDADRQVTQIIKRLNDAKLNKTLGSRTLILH